MKANRFNPFWLWFGIALLLSILPFRLYGHAFGERYDLPLPMNLYLAAAALVVLLSFILATYIIRDGKVFKHYHLTLLDLSSQPALTTTLIFLLRLFGVLLFLFVLACGFFGDQDTFNNFSPTFVWVIWWVGLAFFSALIGNVWSLINPWLSLALLSKWLYSTFSEKELHDQQNRLNKTRPYPKWLSAWPSVISLLIFSWLELIWPGSEKPMNIAILIVLYSAYIWVGMYCFGIYNWLHHAEIFNRIFTLFGRFAPFSFSSGKVQLRLPGTGLTNDHAERFSSSLFIILLLSIVSFDGLLETPLWQSVLDAIAQSEFLRPTLLDLQNRGVDLITLIKSVALMLAPLLLMFVYLLFCKLSSMASGSYMPIEEVAGQYIYSLVPIALAYHISHYLSYLLIAGQQIIPLISDPFGFGWNLFNTTHHHLDISVVNAKMVWYSAVFSIVLGHIIAVTLAHVRALQIYHNRVQVFKSQLPLVVLMIAYTLLSLWILSQPIVE